MIFLFQDGSSTNRSKLKIVRLRDFDGLFTRSCLRVNNQRCLCVHVCTGTGVRYFLRRGQCEIFEIQQISLGDIIDTSMFIGNSVQQGTLFFVCQWLNANAWLSLQMELSISRAGSTPFSSCCPCSWKIHRALFHWWGDLLRVCGRCSSIYIYASLAATSLFASYVLSFVKRVCWTHAKDQILCRGVVEGGDSLEFLTDLEYLKMDKICTVKSTHLILSRWIVSLTNTHGDDQIDVWGDTCAWLSMSFAAVLASRNIISSSNLSPSRCRWLPVLSNWWGQDFTMVKKEGDRAVRVKLCPL